MTHFADWPSPATLRPLALALLHFFWQGAALAALAYALMALFRSAATRYAVAVAAMILMVSAPVRTFFVLAAEKPAGTPPGARDTVVPSSAHTAPFAPGATIHESTSHEATPAYFLWLVEAWFAGVMLLSLRSAGGFLAVERLRRKESTPLEKELLELCLCLQRRMGLKRVVRYCHCVHLDAPAVAGWMRPVVFLPMTALTGLSAAQLEAIIAHELAHIRRFDAFVNLFQIAVETLLFYHPAVWWLGRQIRAERENCCDDEAVALCGSPVNYAKALAHMAAWQVAPRLAMAANHAPLAARVARLLGANESAGTFRRASLSAGALCLSAALLADGAPRRAPSQARSGHRCSCGRTEGRPLTADQPSATARACGNPAGRTLRQGQLHRRDEGRGAHKSHCRPTRRDEGAGDYARVRKIDERSWPEN